MEFWKQIVGFEGLYEVSNNGKIKSLGNGKSTNSNTKKERFLTIKVTTNGYTKVKLSKNSKRFYFSVHRLVALNFIENPSNKREVNHIDGNKLNNCVDNLEWITSSDNQKHAFGLGLQKSIKGKDHLQSIPINQFDLNGNFIKEWDSINSLKRILGFNSFGIIGCCKKKVKHKTAYGFKWEYKNDIC